MLGFKRRFIWLLTGEPCSHRAKEMCFSIAVIASECSDLVASSKAILKRYIPASLLSADFLTSQRKAVAYSIQKSLTANRVFAFEIHHNEPNQQLVNLLVFNKLCLLGIYPLTT